MAAPRHLVAKRRAAAEQVCWRLMMMMGVTGLDMPADQREMLSEAFEKWADLAVETGAMKP